MISAPDPNEDFQDGTVVQWHEGRGMGFIKPADGTPDRFVHRSALADGQALTVGAAVTFQPGFDQKKGKPICQAVSGAVPNGAAADSFESDFMAAAQTEGLQTGTVKTWLEDRGMAS